MMRGMFTRMAGSQIYSGPNFQLLRESLSRPRQTGTRSKRTGSRDTTKSGKKIFGIYDSGKGRPNPS